MKPVYDSFKIYKWHDELSPMKTREDETRQLPTFQQLLTMSFKYAVELYNRIRARVYNVLHNKDTTKKRYVDKNELFEKMNY
eukprot:5532082-Amphidinium_carterae.1